MTKSHSYNPFKNNNIDSLKKKKKNNNIDTYINLIKTINKIV